MLRKTYSPKSSFSKWYILASITKTNRHLLSGPSKVIEVSEPQNDPRLTLLQKVSFWSVTSFLQLSEPRVRSPQSTVEQLHKTKCKKAGQGTVKMRRSEHLHDGEHQQKGQQTTQSPVHHRAKPFHVESFASFAVETTNKSWRMTKQLT